MTDLLHWYARAHGPRAYRIVRAALDGELDATTPESEVGALDDAAPAADTPVASTGRPRPAPAHEYGLADARD